MTLRYLSIFGAIMFGSVVALATDNLSVTLDPSIYQVGYASNLSVGDSYVNLTNVGAPPLISFNQGNAAPAQPANLCANVYTFSPDEQLISCCSCPVTPDALVSLSARNDLISNTLTPAVPTSIVIKVVGSSGPVCNASTVGTISNFFAPGLAAWSSTIHALPVTPGTPDTTYGRTETPFTKSTLGIGEAVRLATLCLGIQIDGSGFGICRSYRLGGLAPVQP